METDMRYLPDDPMDPTDPGDGGGGGGGTPPPPTSYGTVIFNQPFTKLDATSALDILVYLNCYNMDDFRFSVYIFLDDNLVQVGTWNLLLDEPNSQAQGTTTMSVIVEGIAAGPHTCVVRLKNRETEGPTRVQAGSNIKIGELRQAAR